MKSLFAAAVLAATLSGLGAASAMPMAPLGAGESADVIQVAQGCGPGWARGPYGRCRPMYRAAPVYAPRPVYRAARGGRPPPRLPPRLLLARRPLLPLSGNSAKRHVSNGKDPARAGSFV